MLNELELRGRAILVARITIAAIAAAFCACSLAWGLPEASENSATDTSQNHESHTGSAMIVSTPNDGGLIRPRDYYSLQYAFPDDQELCDAFAKIMRREYIPSAEDATREGGVRGDKLQAPGVLLMGSTNIVEKWRPKELITPLDYHQTLGVFEADIDQDGLSDRLYRVIGGRPAKAPIWEVYYSLLRVAFGKNRLNDIDEEVSFVDIFGSDKGETGYYEFDMWDTRRGKRAYAWQGGGSLFNYSLFEYEEKIYLIAATPIYPIDSYTNLFLVRFNENAPYIACYLRGNLTTNGSYPDRHAPFMRNDEN